MDYTCIGIWAVIALAVIGLYYLRFVRCGYEYQEHDPIYFDQDDPADVWEHAAITEQRRSARERGPELIWRDNDE